MAGDIFFTSDRVWSSNSIGFVDIIERAIGKCRDNEEWLIMAFSEALELQCLGINLREDLREQVAICVRLLDAAREDLRELHENPEAHPVEVKSVEELVNLAQAHLTDLNNRLF